MKVAKSNPKLIDKVIDYIQDELEFKLGFDNWENNHRAYKTPIANERFFKAEIFTENGEYKECFLDDRLSATSFFIASDDTEIRNGVLIQNCSFIFQCRLSDLYSVDHRADEELRMDLFNVFNNLDDSLVIFEGFQTGVESVYNEFDRTGLKYHDFGDFHVIRVNFKVRISGACNC